MKSTFNRILFFCAVMCTQLACTNGNNNQQTSVAVDSVAIDSASNAPAQPITDSIAADTASVRDSIEDAYVFDEPLDRYSLQRIFYFISCIPDHHFDLSTEVAYTKSYFSLLKEAWAIPSDAPHGYIGSEEWLYCFLSGNGEPNNVVCISQIQEEQEKATIYFSCDFIYGNYQLSCEDFLRPEHELNLVKENGRWVIADFDNTKDRLYQYIKKVRTFYCTQPWEDHFRQLDGTTEEDIDMRRREVEQYFKNYPNDR